MVVWVGLSAATVTNTFTYGGNTPEREEHSMPVFRKAKLHTPDGLIYEFTEHSWSTSCEIFREPRYIGDRPELVDLHDSVTMPKISRWRKRASFRILAGMSGKNPTSDVNIKFTYGSLEFPAGTRFI